MNKEQANILISFQTSTKLL